MKGHTKETFYIERRSGKDRRKSNGFSFQTIFFKGRREFVRRKEDRHRIFFVDRYSPALFAAIVIILFLSAIDALLTLFLMNYGAYEVNPIMAYYLEVGPYTFWTVKYLLTSVALIFLLLFRNIFIHTVRIHTQSLFYFIAAAMASVVAWECYLVFNVVI